MHAEQAVLNGIQKILNMFISCLMNMEHKVVTVCQNGVSEKQVRVSNK